MKNQSTNNTLHKQELQEVSILNNWVKAYQIETAGKKYSPRSNDLGGHMEIKEGDLENSIGPSEQRVRELLEDCGKKLGIHYVNR